MNERWCNLEFLFAQLNIEMYLVAWHRIASLASNWWKERCSDEKERNSFWHAVECLWNHTIDSVTFNLSSASQWFQIHKMPTQATKCLKRIRFRFCFRFLLSYIYFACSNRLTLKLWHFANEIHLNIWLT